METMTKRVKLDRTAKEYILNAIDPEAYDVKAEGIEAKLSFLADTFKKEHGYMIERVGPQNAMREWIMGLPSAFNIDFENYKILEITKEWGSIDDKSTERRKDMILNNWFNFISVKTFQLFRKYKIAI